MKGTRDLRVDNVRGVLIFLVVAGHFLLPVNGERLTMNLMYLIYSFHMPCFMLVSGYLSHGIYTRERGFRWDRWVQLLWLFILFKLMVNVTEGMLAAIDAEGTQTEIATQDGYFVLTPEFKGTIYFPAALLGGAEEISQFGVSVDGTHDAEFVVLNAYGCQNTGDPLEEPVINDNNMIVTADEGIEVAAGFQITKTGTVQNNGVHIVQDPVPFDSKYLGIELAVTETVQFENDHNILFKIAINGNDLIRLGFRPGVRLGLLLGELRDLFLEGVLASREELLEYAREQLPSALSENPDGDRATKNGNLSDIS